MVAAAFRVGLRVADVEEAARFYRGFGFGEVGTVPDAQGRPVMTILDRGVVHLIVDALVGMPFADSERERQTQAGPRGLGVAIGLGWMTLMRVTSTAERLDAPSPPSRWTRRGATACSNASIHLAMSGSSPSRSQMANLTTASRPCRKSGSEPSDPASSGQSVQERERHEHVGHV